MIHKALLLTIILTTACSGLAAETPSTKAQEYKAQHSVRLDPAAHEVDLDFVKEAVKSKGYTIIDARGDDYLMPGGPMIPGAIHVPSDTASEEILKKIAAKDSKILVYCGGVLCPAGTKLANRLVEMGYKDVNEFPGGIQAWKAAGLKTQQKPEEK